jgi:hypothetical protein
MSCFTGLGDRFGLFRALNSEMDILDSMNDHLATRSMVDKQKGLFMELLGYIEKMADEHPSSKSSSMALRQDMIMVFGNLVNAAYHNVGDIAALEQWKGKLRELQNGNGVSDIMDVLLADSNLAKYLFRGRDSGKAYCQSCLVCRISAAIVTMYKIYNAGRK